MATDVAGAFNNRGIAYERLGETDQALQDFASAVQYDPNWPEFRMNKADIEARMGRCADALADADAVLKLSRRKAFVESRARMAASCPVLSEPSN